MLSLNIKLNKSFAKIFTKKYIQNLIDARDRIISSGICIQIDNNSKNIRPSKSNLKLLGLLSDSKLKEIMLLKPIEQRKIIKELKDTFPSIYNKKTKIYQFLKYIFITNGYDMLDVKEKRLFFTNLKISTCIYCNRNYIFGIDENGHIKGQIDHFYPKAKYPYFAMNYFNFIPVCESCNKVKNEFDTASEIKQIIHPYERKEKKVFKITMSAINDFSYVLDNDDLLKKLHIEKIYNTGHKDIIQDLYIKFFQQNTKEYFDSLQKSLKGFFDDDEIHKLISSGYFKYEEHHKKSLSKVIKDIREEFEERYKNE